MSLFNKPPNERPFVRPEPPPPDATPSVKTASPTNVATQGETGCR